MREAYDNNQSFIEKMSDEFKDFVFEEGFTGSEVEQAYYLFCGVSEEDESVSENVSQLRTKMEEMSGLGYPINRFIEFAREGSEVDNFKKNVAELRLSDREKDVLNSIVTKGRGGEIRVSINNIDYRKFKIMEGVPKEKLAKELNSDLLTRLAEISDGEISVWFEEGA
jgi:hypothetical protein